VEIFEKALRGIKAEVDLSQVTQCPDETFAENFNMVTSVRKRAGLRCLRKTHATEAQRFRAPFVLFIWPTSSIDQTGVKRTPVIAVNVVSTVVTSGLAVSTYFVSMVVSPISVDTSNTTSYLQRLVCLEG
jgi:hypothetical protein